MTRKRARVDDLAQADSNYLPALEVMSALVHKYSHDEVALSVFFLSDGSPTDAKELSLTPKAAERRICDKISGISFEYGFRFHFLAAGFGNNRQDFSVLEAMVNSVKENGGEAEASFIQCRKLYSTVGSAISSLALSTMKTRTTLQIARERRGQTVREISSEKTPGYSLDWQFLYIRDHFVFDRRTKHFVSEYGLPPGAVTNDNMKSSPSRGFGNVTCLII